MDTIAFLREIYKDLDNSKKEQLAQVVDNFKFLQAENEQLKAQAPLPEAPASANVRVVNPKTQMEWQVTVRAHSPVSLFEYLSMVEHGLLERGYIAFDSYVDQRRAERGQNGNGAAAPQNDQALPLPIPAADNKHQQSVPAQPLTFSAQSLVGSINNGKTYWKVMGGKFSRYGVTVWPETLEAAGFFVDQLDPMQAYDLTGYTAVYVIKEDGKVDKVVQLTK